MKRSPFFLFLQTETKSLVRDGTLPILQDAELRPPYGPPRVVGASLEVFRMMKESDALHTKQQENVVYFREKMLAAGFDIKPTQSAICAVMLYDAKLSQVFAARMADEGIYVTGFYYPVVP